LATLWLVGPSVNAAAESLKQHWNQQPVQRRSDVGVALSSLEPDVTVLRWAAVSTEMAMTFAQEALSFVPNLLGDDPFARRP
jgi:urease accessory protein